MGRGLRVAVPLAAMVLAGCLFRPTSSGARTGDAGGPPPTDGGGLADGHHVTDGVTTSDGVASTDGGGTSSDAITAATDPCTTAMQVTGGPVSCDQQQTSGSNSVVATSTVGDAGCTWSVMLQAGASGMNPNFVVRVTEAPGTTSGAAFVQATGSAGTVRVEVTQAGSGFTASATSGWNEAGAAGTVTTHSICLRIVERPSIDGGTHAEYYDPADTQWLPLGDLNTVLGNPLGVELGVHASNNALVQAKLDHLGSGTL